MENGRKILKQGNIDINKKKEGQMAKKRKRKRRKKS